VSRNADSSEDSRPAVQKSKTDETAQIVSAREIIMDRKEMNLSFKLIEAGRMANF
jgi:hypothetical protein